MEKTSAADDWNQIQALFPAQKGITAKSWTFGISRRLSRKRLARLLETPAAGELALFLDQCSDQRVKALRTFAAINLEQTLAAVRISVIANVSVPVLLLTLINQLFPGAIGRIYLSGANMGNGIGLRIQLIIMGAALLWLLAIILYAALCMNQARDIRHLIDLTAAERGIYFGLEDTVVMQSD